MRLHFKFKGCAVFLRDSGFVQQSNPLDRKKRHVFCDAKIPPLFTASDLGVKVLCESGQIQE